MDVADNFNGWLELKKNRLICENVLNSKEKVHDILLRNLNILITICLLGVDTNLLVFLKI